MHKLVVWDFDGTLIPFDSEQYLLTALPLPGLKRLGARLFVYADRHGLDPGVLKRLYGWCLRGTPLDALDPVCTQIASHIPERERQGIRRLAANGIQMVIVSCGTMNLSQSILQVAGLADSFGPIRANALYAAQGHVTGIERRIYRPEGKLKVVAQYAVPWEQVIAVGDGLTDVPLLDRVGFPILIASESKAAQFANRGYAVVRSLADAVALLEQIAAI